MREISVDRLKLLECLKVNKQQHVEQYLKAIAGYQIELKEKLQEELAALTKDMRYDSLSLVVRAPMSHIQDYDVAISMVEWSTESEIKLTEDEFRQYVLDTWTWKDNFGATSAFYVNKLSTVKD